MIGHWRGIGPYGDIETGAQAATCYFQLIHSRRLPEYFDIVFSLSLLDAASIGWDQFPLIIKALIKIGLVKSHPSFASIGRPADADRSGILNVQTGGI
jgi:hypothetical protein